ncbi:MAG: hypothetical protein P4L77_03610 [Sulfuriferula sp.]|nr:hypothetical protein [Sulfuriferula sp.]
MKYLLIAVAIATTAAVAQAHAANVGVSVSVGQPGFYGQIDIGGYPQPRVIYQQPMVVREVPRDRPPIYLRVPPGYANHWEKHCREYNACGERVYFVQDNWYKNEYAPRYQQGRRDHRDDARDEHRDEHRDDRHDNRDNREHGREQ